VHTVAQTPPEYNPRQAESGHPPGDPLSEALRLAALGFSVIPLHPGSKRPAVRWKPWQTKCPSPALLRKWWGENPRRGVGIVTGQVSGVLVLDVDPRNGGLESVIGKALPLTPTTQTPSGGLHYYYRLPQGKALGSRPGVLPGVDVKAEGGFVVAPPSRREEGAYSWLVTLEEADLADPPSWLLELLEEAPAAAAGAPADRPPLDLPPGDLPPGVTQGRRNDTAARLVGLWLAQGLPAADVWARAWAWNQRNSPPLEEAELWRVLGSISRAEARKPPGARGVRIPRTLLRAEVSWPAKVLGAVLAALAQTGQPRPSPPDLAAILKASPRSVFRWGAELKAADLADTLEDRPRRRFAVITPALLTDPTLPVEVKAAALALAAAATDGKAQVGQDTLAQRLQVSRRQTVAGQLAALEAAGYVVCDRQRFAKHLGRRPGCNKYTFCGTEKRSLQAASRAEKCHTPHLVNTPQEAQRRPSSDPETVPPSATHRTYSEAVLVPASGSGDMDTPGRVARAPRREVTPPEVEISPAILAKLAYPVALALIQTHGEAAVLAYVQEHFRPKEKRAYGN
jgi:hypothetical protein